MRTLFLLVLFVFCASPVLAQQKVADKKFIFTSSLLVGATVFNVESTFAALDKCNHTCEEGNLLMKPLFNLGRPAVYAVDGGVNAGIIYASYHMKKKGFKGWWLPQLAGGAVYAIAGGFNMRFTF